MPALSKHFYLFFCVALAGVGIGDALAKETKMQGMWCSLDEKETLYINSDSIGFNEHTMCNLDDPLPEGAHIKLPLTCANIYIHGNEIIKAFEETKMFEAFYTTPNQLKIFLGDETDPIVYSRCYE